MSVPVSCRKDGKLEVIVKCRYLAKWTTQVFSNENKFDARYARDIASHIIRTVWLVCEEAELANKIRVTNKEWWGRRKNLQLNCIENCKRLGCDTGMCQDLYHMSSKRVEYWDNMIEEVEKLLIAWHSSDKKRYNEKWGS